MTDPIIATLSQADVDMIERALRPIDPADIVEFQYEDDEDDPA